MAAVVRMELEDILEEKLHRLAVNTIKMLAVDGVERAHSGHPGMPMGAADYAFVLWHQYLRYSPSEPSWPNRDRFVLSAGHGSMLLYALLHLAGFELSKHDLESFRQWGSRTPGHPEVGCAPGVEATTGPLGQGVGTAVGMALAERMAAARFNQPDFSPIAHRTWAIVSDGDLMEGIASEAASWAGHLKLDNLTLIYDDNRISIDGPTEITFTEDVAKRFRAYGWATRSVDGHDRKEIVDALDWAKAQTGQPTLILARTHIGHGSPNQHDSPSVHGSPLGKEETEATKKALSWPTDEDFHVPEEVRALFSQRTSELEEERKAWETNLEAWKKAHPELAQLWKDFKTRELPQDLYAEITSSLSEKPNATRSISAEIQQEVARRIPMLVGGSADLAASTKTTIKKSAHITPEDFTGRNFHFGIREHGMGAILNGMALYGGWIPFGSTFLVFSDYLRPSIRVAALSHLPVLYIFTHDSFFLGEDGPTHQPIEQIPSLRLIPNLALFRPADALECAAAWQMALDRQTGPSALILSRQKIDPVKREPSFAKENILRGGYVISEAKTSPPDLVMIATGSELPLAVEAKSKLEAKGISTRVVSMPCLEIFAAQDEAYRHQVLPPQSRAVAIEAAQGDLWHKWVGRNGLVIGIDHFGASAPDSVLAEKFGFTPERVTERILAWFRS